MRLWLDDARPAPDGFDVVVSTAQAAVDALQTGEVEYCSLDHDLADDAAGTGYDVASFIESAAYRGTLPRLKWNVHSANPAGAARMIQALRNADRYWDQREAQGMKTSMVKYRFRVSARKFTQEEAKAIAAELGINFDAEGFDLNQFTRGLNVELEHGSHDQSTDVSGDDPMVTGKIAWAHLKELTDYYDRLKVMEQEGEAEQEHSKVASSQPPSFIRVWGGVYRLAVQGREVNPRQLADKIDMYMRDIMDRMQRETTMSVQRLQAAVQGKGDSDLAAAAMDKLKSLEDRCKVLYEDTWTILDELKAFDAGAAAPIPAKEPGEEEK